MCVSIKIEIIIAFFKSALLFYEIGFLHFKISSLQCHLHGHYSRLISTFIGLKCLSVSQSLYVPIIYQETTSLFFVWDFK